MVRSLKHKGGKTMKRRVSKGGAKKSKKHLGKKSKKHVGKKSKKHNKTKRSAKKGGGLFSSKETIEQGDYFGWWLYEVQNGSSKYEFPNRIIGEIGDEYITVSNRIFNGQGTYTYYQGLSKKTYYHNDNKILASAYAKVYDKTNFVIEENEHKTFGFF
jgi:hypothetical protein